jgi:hypothetical protein
MAYPKRAIVDPVRTLGFAAIGAAYAPIGTPTASFARQIKLINLTDADVAISIDGVNDHFILTPTAPGNVDTLSFCSNRTTIENCFLAEGTQFYVKDVAAATTSGSVYIQVLR